MSVRCGWGICLLGLALAGCSGEDTDSSRIGGLANAQPSTDSVAASQTFDLLFANAREAHFAGEFDSAVVLLQAIYDQARDQEDIPAQARALTWIGLAHWRLGDHPQSRRIGRTALDLKQRHGLVKQYWQSYNALGLLAWMENRLSDAERWYQQALESARKTDDRSSEATTLANLGLVQTELGQFADARAGFTAQQVVQADLRREIEQNSGDARREIILEGNAYTNLGMLEIRLGDPRAALPLLHQALDMYQSVDYGTGTQSALGQLGTAYTALGDSRQAFVVLDSAFTVASAQGLDQEQASILEAIAELYRGAGDFRRALEVYDSAKTINAALGLDIETGTDLRGEADIHVRLGDMERARRSAAEALDIHRRAGAPLEVLLDLLILAEILDRLAAADEVEVRLHEARGLADELGARIARVEVGLTEARIADRHRRSPEVLAAIDRIEPDLSRGGYSAEWEARLLQSRALERLGRSREAMAAGRQALATVERVRGNFGSGMLRTAFVADKREVYAHLIAVLLRSGRVEEAFAVADAARGRVLLERLSSAGSGGGSASMTFADGELLLSEIDRLVESIDYTEEEFPPDEVTADQRRELERLYDRLSRARREYEGLLVHAAETDRNQAAFLGGAPTDVAAVQAVLRPSQLLVEYFVPPEGPVLIFVVSRDAVHALESSVTTQNLASRVRLARDLIGREGSGEQLNRVLSALHEALIQPLILAGFLSEVEELIVVPHQVLVYLPFAALRDATTERYLIEGYMMRVLPSAAALPLLAGRSPDETGLGTASVFAPFPKELPASLLELKAVRVDGPVERYTGSRATELALRGALMNSAVVHVATHGVMNAMNPMFSRLELARNNGGDPADDGRLEVHELLSLSIETRLVFLSGCETGVGAAHATAFAQGEDYTTLAQAFLNAGAGAVIATLWPVQDAGAAVFAEHFYDGLAGSAPARALAQAQRAMLADGRYGSPYYWASYQLAG
ncbi:MAG: CHAT domain-containing protein [Gemmatimonadetes bacterium]|nr:CHAT domain-containing protein [Gemmatimonadota bacterium]